MSKQIENMEDEINNLLSNIQSLKIAFTQVCKHRDSLEAENLGLRLECQGLKAEVAEYKSYWKEATRKNRSLLEENADLMATEPLTMDQIADAQCATEATHAKDFYLGVRFAEKHHNIGGQ